MQTKLNFTALITETKGKLTTPSVANRVDAFVKCTSQSAKNIKVKLLAFSTCLLFIFTLL